MSDQVTHEAERQRQHARYRIPLSLQIGDAQYRVREWSVSGFSIEGQLDKPVGTVFDTAMSFAFDAFAATFSAQAEVVWIDTAKDTTGCRFHNLDKRQLSVLRYVVDAYLAGEIVTVNDVVEIVKRDNFHAKNDPTGGQQQPGRWRRATQKAVGLALIAALFVGLVMFTGSALYDRLYMVDGRSAVIDAPIVVIRSPQPSYFAPMTPQTVDTVTTGQAIATMELIGGGATTIDSPCDCQLLSFHVLPREFVALGEPLMTLLPSDAQPFVSVQVNWEDLNKIRIGHPATITLADGRTIDAKVATTNASVTLERRYSTPLNNVTSNPVSYAEVIVKPNEPFSADYLGTPVVVTIDTYRL